MNIRGAIFDLDGTLLDSMKIWDTIGEDYLLSLGITPHEDINALFRTMSLYDAACYYKTEYGVHGSPEQIVAGVNAMIAHFYRDEVQPKPGVGEFLSELERRGVKKCIATATDECLVSAALRRTGLMQYFTGIFTCTAVGCDKNQPRIFDTALAHLGTRKQETIVFEDALHAIRTAKEAGYTVWAVYDASAGHRDEIQKLADRYINDFIEARKMLI